MFLVFILFSLVGGTLLATQKLLNARLGVFVGGLRSSFINHIVGTLFGAMMLLVGIRTGVFTLEGLPYYYLLGGCMGLFAVALANYAIVCIGAMATSIAFVLFQLLTSSLLDHFGWLAADAVPLSPLRCIGIFLVALGVVLASTRKSEPILHPLPPLQDARPE